VGAAVAGSFVANLDARLAGVQLGAAARTAVQQAKRLPLGRPDVHTLPVGQGRALSVAADEASLHSFHVGMAIAAILLATGGIIGAVGIRNKRGSVTAEECSAGQLVGTGRELAEGHGSGAAQPG
jgi:hypothetical protein